MTHIEANAAAHERHEDEASEFESWANENAADIWAEIFADGGYMGIAVVAKNNLDVRFFALAAIGDLYGLAFLGKTIGARIAEDKNLQEKFDKIAADMWRKVKNGSDE